MTWWITAPRIYVRGVCVFATNIRLFPPLEDMELYQSFTDEFFGPAFAVLGGA